MACGQEPGLLALIRELPPAAQFRYILPLCGYVNVRQEALLPKVSCNTQSGTRKTTPIPSANQKDGLPHADGLLTHPPGHCFAQHLPANPALSVIKYGRPCLLANAWCHGNEKLLQTPAPNSKETKPNKTKQTAPTPKQTNDTKTKHKSKPSQPPRMNRMCGHLNNHMFWQSTSQSFSCRSTQHPNGQTSSGGSRRATAYRRCPSAKHHGTPETVEAPRPRLFDPIDHI